MAARADRGIFLATAPFSPEAKREAAREGAAPIEMVDLVALIQLMADLGLGVTTRTVFAVDEGFFRKYMAPDKKDEAATSLALGRPVVPKERG